MHHITRRLSPSLLLAIGALFLALAGTAVAAGEIITEPSQVAKGVITGSHLRDKTVSQADLKHPTLRLRVSKDGKRIGGGDGTVTRAPSGSAGEYLVTFDAGPLNAFTGENTDTVLNRNCAITATPRDGFAWITVLGPLAGLPNTVRVHAVFPDPTLQFLKGVDTGFDITASC